MYDETITFAGNLIARIIIKLFEHCEITRGELGVIMTKMPKDADLTSLTNAEKWILKDA